VITKMEVFSSSPSAPELPLGGFMPNDDPVQIRSVDGLGPVKANIASTPFATGRGELYQGASTGKRNIVLNLGFNPHWEESQTMSTLRQILYRYLLPEQWTKLRFFSDELPTVDIEGYVEAFEPNLFSQDPEVQVSVICPRPDFIEADATIHTGLVDDGTIETVFDYLGTVPTGFELRVDRTIDNPSYTGPLSVIMKSPFVPQTFEVDPVTIDTTKYFKLSTVRNAKRVQNVAITDGAVTNLLSDVSDASVWPEIKPGENAFSIAASEPEQLWTLAYFNRFGGL
jgi:hypothetical protein